MAFVGIVWYSQLKMAEAAAASSAVGEFFFFFFFFLAFRFLKVLKKKATKERKKKLTTLDLSFSSLKIKTIFFPGSGGAETARERERGAETIPLTNKPPASPKTVGLVGVGKDARA